MATKPTLSLSRFGETAGGSTAGANLLVPSSGLRDSGFQPNTPALSGYVNELIHQAYLWFKWLDDGVMTLTDLHLTGTLEVDGTSQFDGAATFNAGLTMVGSDISLGTQKVKFSDKKFSYTPTIWDVIDSTGSGTVDKVSPTVGPGIIQNDTAGFTAYYRLPPIPWEWRLKSVTVFGSGTSTGVTLMSVDGTATPATAITGASNIAFSAGSAVLTPSTPVAATGKSYLLRVITTGGNDATLLGYDITVDSV